MKKIVEIHLLRKQLRHWREEGKSIGFVPTMGALHEGHMALVKHAKSFADIAVVSIFVNPIQFNNSDDFDHYPRDLSRDLALLTNLDVDVVFCPLTSAMVPTANLTTVHVDSVSLGLCGASRPGHFDGVCFIVNKLLNVVHPTFAIFGQKDYQQLAVIRQMVHDLEIDCKIVGHETVREPDGLALSSRNQRLTDEDRARAPVLFRILKAGEAMARSGMRMRSQLIDAMQTKLTEEGDGFVIDYLEIVDRETLLPFDDAITKPALIAIAGNFGDVRLIDNIEIDP